MVCKVGQVASRLEVEHDANLFEISKMGRREGSDGIRNEED